MNDSQQLVDRSGANNPMFGKTHTPEAVSKMSDSQQLVDRSGANNPMYGKVAANAMTVNVYSIDNVLVGSFTSQIAAANWVNIPRSTFKGYLSSGKVWNNKYFFRKFS